MTPREATRQRTALLESALHDARRGWLVFPLYSVADGRCSCGGDCGNNAGKHPRTTHGLLEATSDEAQVAAWWAQWPHANVGIRTGAESGIVALDVDAPKGGLTSLATLQTEHGALPDTVEQLTGGIDPDTGQRSRQLFFQHPGASVQVRNSAGTLGPGLDVRGDGGYVVVSPSIHHSGRSYEWEAAHHPDEVPLAPIPPWLLPLVVTPTATRNGDRSSEEWAGLLQGAPLGQRHAVATRIAGHFLGRRLPPAEVTEILLGFAVRCRPPYDPEDVRRIVRDLAQKDATKAPPPAADGLGLVSLGELLGEPDATHVWVVAGRLPAAGLGLLAGKPKVGKSTAARCLALAVARGEPWLGHKTTGGAVIYLALEEKRQEVRDHFRALGARVDDPVFVLCMAAPADALPRLRHEAETRHPVLIIIDPLFRFVRVEDGNDYATMTAALEPLLTLARETGACVLLVHHLGKGQRSDGDNVLGSTAIFGAVDSALLMKRGDRYRTLSSLQRYGDDLEEVVVELDPVTRTVLAGATRAQAEQDDAARLILTFLDSAPAPVTEAELDEGTECRTRLRRMALRALVAEGKIVRTGRGGKSDPYRYALGTRIPEGASA